ncbi:MULTISPECIES: hypothetical protein [Nocardia]|jgi:transposase InsO family protein|uniref:hypothetical protein n=1 Tax=Nocardia TaxID=1817 RepID=UPI0009FD9D17|nr:hypothetical protein [Nocardia mangyaensis]
MSTPVAWWLVDRLLADRGVGRNALGMAIDGRRPGKGAVIHSDQGVQFGSWAFTQCEKDSGLVSSMGSVGGLLRQRGDGVVLVPDAG